MADANRRETTKILVSIDAEVALEPSQSPPVGAGSEAFAHAVRAAVAAGAPIKVDAVRTVTVATPSYGEPVGERRPLSWTTATTDADGVDVAERRFNVEQRSNSYELQTGGPGRWATVAILTSRTDAERLGSAWRAGLIEIGTPDRPMRRSA